MVSTMTTPARRLTPHDLALWGVVSIVLGAVLAVILNRAFDHDTDGAGLLIQILSVVAYVVGLVLLVGAGIAKAVQVGVRTGRDDS